MHSRWTHPVALLTLSLAVGCATGSKAVGSSDVDHDGVSDEKDECPDAPEEPGGDGDGCPDAPNVVLESGRFVIRGKVVFPLNSAELLPANAKLLDTLAKLLKETSQLKKVQIEGHTDDTGEETFNQQLSLQRAETVQKALLQRGIDAEMLSVKGFGKTVPLSPNDTPEGRARNRRVEFHVLE